MERRLACDQFWTREQVDYYEQQLAHEILLVVSVLWNSDSPLNSYWW
jgi:hypothetical protein